MVFEILSEEDVIHWTAEMSRYKLRGALQKAFSKPLSHFQFWEHNCWLFDIKMDFDLNFLS